MDTKHVVELRENGYAVIRGFLDKDEVAELRRESEKVYAEGLKHHATYRDRNLYFEVINDPANGKMFVHCKGGKHRAGVTAAVYRMTKYGWDYDKAYAEMMNYKFNTSWGRKVMKTFVQDYAAKMKNTNTTANVTAAGR